MDIYLPIAGLSVKIVVIILLGGAVGMLSGMFGVGGGFLTTPLLIFYGIPPTVAAASASTQVTGASVSGDGALTLTATDLGPDAILFDRVGDQTVSAVDGKLTLDGSVKKTTVHKGKK